MKMDVKEIMWYLKTLVKAMMWKKQVFGLNILIWTFEIIVTIFCGGMKIISFKI